MPKPDVTGPDQADTKFRAGQSGNPSGRPRGSRNKLSEAFLSALDADFELHGPDVITKVREQDTTAYLKIVANLMPARLEAQLEAKIEVDIFNDKSIAEVLEFVANEVGSDKALKLAEIFELTPPNSLIEGMPLLPAPKLKRAKRIPAQQKVEDGQP